MRHNLHVLMLTFIIVCFHTTRHSKATISTICLSLWKSSFLYDYTSQNSICMGSTVNIWKITWKVTKKMNSRRRNAETEKENNKKRILMAHILATAGFKSHYLSNETKQETPNQPSLMQWKIARWLNLIGVMTKVLQPKELKEKIWMVLGINVGGFP